MRALLPILGFMLAIGGSALAADQKVGDLTITQPWSRATAPGAENGVVYLGISNGGASEDRLVAASSDAAASAGLHQTDHSMPGMVMMNELKGGVAIPAGQTVTLKPDSVHVMLMGLKHQLKPGETVPLTLTFEKAGKVDIAAEVAPPGAAKPPAH